MCMRCVTTYEKYHSAATAQEVMNKAKLNKDVWRRLKPFKAVRGVEHEVSRNYRILPLIRALPWPFNPFYLNIFCRVDLLNQESMQREESRHAEKQLKWLCFLKRSAAVLYIF